MSNVVLVAAARTPIGSLSGALGALSAPDLGARVIAAVLDRAGISGTEIDEVVMGQVLTAVAGMNPARQAARGAGVRDEAPAMTVNQVCGSGLRAVALGAQQIALVEARIVIAGGQESMTNAPHAAIMRQGKKLGPVTLLDTAMHDGLTDAFHDYPMGETAEIVATRYQIGRAAQDAFALASQRKASGAQKDGRFDTEIVPVAVPGRGGDLLVKEDEHIRHDVDEAGLARLKPVFRSAGSVTAGNASGINDGLQRCCSCPRRTQNLAASSRWHASHRGRMPGSIRR